MRKLLLLRDLAIESFEREFGSSAKIVQAMPPRIAVVEAEAPTFESIAKDGRVVLLDQTGAAAASEDLSPSEDLFIKAWLSRDPDKQRPGEGLEWDAEGFSAP